jgi:hypothetical protein
MEQNNKHNSSLGSDCFRDTAYNNFEVKSWPYTLGQKKYEDIRENYKYSI